MLFENKDKDKDLRLEINDKDLWSEDKDKNLKFEDKKGQGLANWSSRITIVYKTH